MARQPMPISTRWFQGAVLTYVIGFTALGILAYLVYRDQPPIPRRVVAGERVYGMLAIGLLLFCLRYLTRPDKWSDRAAMTSFWSLNIGLSWMAFFNLFPLGIVQLYQAVDTGYWYARSLDFLMVRWVNILEWARLPGDAVFILGGALPLIWLCWRALRYPNPNRIESEVELPTMLFTDASTTSKPVGGERP